MKLEELFGESNETITDEAKVLIKEAFESSIEERTTLVKEQLDAEYTAKITELMEATDLDHATKFKQALEKIDEDHTAKAKEVFTKIDETYADKLKTVKEHYEVTLEASQRKFNETLVEKIDTFLDEEVLEEMVPTKLLEDVAKARKSEKLLESLKEMLNIDEATAKASVRDAILDGGETIKTLQTQLSEATERTRVAEVKNFLLEKTKNFPSDKRSFVVERLEDKDLDFATRNFEHVVTNFDKGSTVTVEKSIKIESDDSSHIVDQQIVSESVGNKNAEENKPNANPFMNIYTAGLNKPLD